MKADALKCCAKWMVLALSLVLLVRGTYSVEKLCGGETTLRLTRYDFWGMRKKGETSIPRARIKNVVIDTILAGRGLTYIVKIQMKTSSITLDARGISQRWGLKMKQRILNDSRRSDFSSIGFHDPTAIILGLFFFIVFLGAHLRVLTIGHES